MPTHLQPLSFALTVCLKYTFRQNKNENNEKQKIFNQNLIFTTKTKTTNNMKLLIKKIE